jgi:hypothetical protein
MGPSSGMSIAFADCLADPRVALVVPALVLRAVVAVEPRGARVEGRPGMVGVWLSTSSVAPTRHQLSVLLFTHTPRGNDSWEQGSRVQGPPLLATSGESALIRRPAEWHHRQSS